MILRRGRASFGFRSGDSASNTKRVRNRGPPGETDRVVPIFFHTIDMVEIVPEPEPEVVPPSDGEKFVSEHATEFDTATDGKASMQKEARKQKSIANLRKDIYIEGHEKRPNKTAEATCAERLIASYPVDKDVEVDAICAEIRKCYCPGAYEVENFELDPDSWHIAAGKLGLGAYIYELPEAGEIKFSDEEEAIKAADFFVKDAGGKWQVAPNWKPRLKLMVNFPPCDDDSKAWKRPPQAVYSSCSNPDATQSRSSFKTQGLKYAAPRGGARIVLLKDGTPVFVGSIQCKAPGFRHIKSDNKDVPSCCAGVLVVIEGSDAEFMEVEALEICIHRATAMLPRDVDSDGAKLSTPMPEFWNEVIHDLMGKDVSETIGNIAVASQKKLKPALVWANLMFKVTAAEELTGNQFRSGGTTQHNVAVEMKAKQKGGAASGKGDATEKRNAKMQMIINCQGAKNNNPKNLLPCSPGFIQRIDFMSDHKTEVVLFDHFRVTKFLEAVTLSPLTYRGVVMDFAMKMAHKLETDNNTKQSLWTLQMVLPHFAVDHGVKATVLTVLEAELSRSNAMVTASAITCFLDALCTANNAVAPWVPAIVTDVSATLLLASTKAFMGNTTTEYKDRVLAFLQHESDRAQSIRNHYKELVDTFKLIYDLCTADSDAGSQHINMDEFYLPPLEETDGMSLHSSDRFRGADVLAYVEHHDPKNPQMHLKLSKQAIEKLREACRILTNLEKSTELRELYDIFVKKADELIEYAIPTIDELRDRKITSVFHCRPHKIRAILGATDFNKNFTALEGLKSYAGNVAYRLIMQGYGPANLHDDIVRAPFAGPKDYPKARSYLKTIGELLMCKFIPCDPDEWPPGWKDTLELKEKTDSQSPDRDSDSPEQYELSIYAGHERVHHISFREDRVVMGIELKKYVADEPEDRGTTPSSPNTEFGLRSSASSEDDSREASDEEEFVENIDWIKGAGADDADTVTDISEVRKAMESEKEEYGERMRDANELYALIEEVPQFWKTMKLQGEAEEELINTMASEENVKWCTVKVENILEDGKYFQNPYFFQAQRTIHSKPKMVYPVASLFKYHSALFFITGPLMRALFPACVSHTSHVEGKFSEMRSELSGDLSLEQYLEEKVGTKDDGSVNLFESETVRFRNAEKDKTRMRRNSVVALQSETYKAGYQDPPTQYKAPKDDDQVIKICQGIRKIDGKKCIIPANCDYGYCGFHCKNHTHTAGCKVHQTGRDKSQRIPAVSPTTKAMHDEGKARTSAE